MLIQFLLKEKGVAGGYNSSFMASLMCNYKENSPQNEKHTEKLWVNLL